MRARTGPLAALAAPSPALLASSAPAARVDPRVRAILSHHHGVTSRMSDFTASFPADADGWGVLAITPGLRGGPPNGHPPNGHASGGPGDDELPPQVLKLCGEFAIARARGDIRRVRKLWRKLAGLGWIFIKRGPFLFLIPTESARAGESSPPAWINQRGPAR